MGHAGPRRIAGMTDRPLSLERIRMERRQQVIESLATPREASTLAVQALCRMHELIRPGQVSTAQQAWSILADLATCMEDLPRSIDKLVRYLRTEEQAGRLRLIHKERRAAVREAMGDAALLSRMIARALNRAADNLIDLYAPGLLVDPAPPSPLPDPPA